MRSSDNKRLLKTLNKLIKQEKWQKLPKKKDEVVEKTLTKSKNLKFVLKNKSIFYVLKRNKNLYKEASEVEIGDKVSVALRTHLGRQYCVKFTRKRKEHKLQEWF